MGKSSSSSTNNTSNSDVIIGRKNCYRGHWRPAEDDKLRDLVQRYGPQNWNFIAEHLHGRSGKSCRLRWYNQLDPNINKKPFSEEEEERLLSVHRVYGNKWACIAKYFHGRTDNAVKNHYHVVMARRKRERRLTAATTSTTTTTLNNNNNRNHNNNNKKIAPSSSSTTIIRGRGVSLHNHGQFGLLYGATTSTTTSTSSGSEYYKVFEEMSNKRNNEGLVLMNSSSSSATMLNKFSLKQAPFIDFLGVGITSN